MNLKKFQWYYIRILFKLKIATDQINPKQIFKRKYGEDVDFKLTDNDINQEKSKILKIDDNNKIENLIEYLKNEVNNFIIKTFDVEYI